MWAFAIGLFQQCVTDVIGGIAMGGAEPDLKQRVWLCRSIQILGRLRVQPDRRRKFRFCRLPRVFLTPAAKVFFPDSHPQPCSCNESPETAHLRIEPAAVGLPGERPHPPTASAAFAHAANDRFPEELFRNRIAPGSRCRRSALAVSENPRCRAANARFPPIPPLF